MRSERGFTLVEAILAGTLSAVIAGVVLSVLFVNNSALSTGATNSKLSEIYAILSADIHRYAYKSSYAIEVNSCPNSAVITMAQTSLIKGFLFCDVNGLPVRGYRIIRASDADLIGTLQENDPANPGWNDFRVGNDTVKIDWTPPASQAASKGSGLCGAYYENAANPTQAQAVWFNFRLNMSVSGNVATTLPVQTESVICRNAVFPAVW